MPKKNNKNVGSMMKIVFWGGDSLESIHLM